MRNFLLRSFLFGFANLLLFWFHFWVFRGPYPFAAWVTALIHIISLIFFPYTNYFKKHEKLP